MKTNAKSLLATLLGLSLVVVGCGNSAEPVSEDPQAYYEDRAQHLVDYTLDDGSMVVTEDAAAQKMFYEEDFAIDLIDAVPAQGEALSEDGKAVQDLVGAYNEITLSSLFSGVYQLMPRAAFVSDAIYEEANARNLYELFNKPMAGKNVASYEFAIEYTQLEVGETYAKVVIKRQADVVYDQEKDPDRSYGGVEGYLLKKVDGEWKIENILFATDAVSPTFEAFVAATDEAVWENYTFEKCPRKSYDAANNFRDFIEGPIDAPSVNLEMMGIDYNVEDE